MNRQQELEAHTSSGSGSGNNNHQTLEEDERQNFEAYQRELNCMRHQEELEVHSSRGSRTQRRNQALDAAAAEDYERN